MNVHDPATWPKHARLSYRRISQAHPTAHAFYDGAKSLCNAMSLVPGGSQGVIPTEGYTRLCSNCIKDLRAWGYLSRSEVVEWSSTPSTEVRGLPLAPPGPGGDSR